MTRNPIDEKLIQQTIHFHGHSCPGLAIGIRAAELALAEFDRALDEEMVAVVETDMCGVDAIQFLTGCTFGKGNLIHKDYGKNAFTFYRRSDEKAIRIVLRSDLFQESDGELDAKKITPEEESQMREIRKKQVMEAEFEELFEIKPVQDPLPKQARILQSLTCESCGETTMESRTRRFLGRTLCIPCFEAEEKRQ
jgi:formylmethanofuran dehydrogenase subunit E